MPKRTKPEVEKQMVEMYLSGRTTEQVADAFSACRATVRRALKKAKIPTRYAQQCEELRACVAQGMRKCRGCGFSRPLDEFHLVGVGTKVAGGRQAHCRDCCSKKNGTVQARRISCLNLTVAQCAYLAGLFDGEAWIGIHGLRSNRKGHLVGCSINMTNPVTWELHKELKIGSAHLIRKEKYGCKDAYLWQMSANGCRSLLPLIAPYMRVKKRQVELVLEYLSYTKHHRATTTHAARAAEIYEELKLLNQKGRREE
jgi:hypothetical protein